MTDNDRIACVLGTTLFAGLFLAAFYITVVEPRIHAARTARRSNVRAHIAALAGDATAEQGAYIWKRAQDEAARLRREDGRHG